MSLIKLQYYFRFTSFYQEKSYWQLQQFLFIFQGFRFYFHNLFKVFQEFLFHFLKLRMPGEFCLRFNTSHLVIALMFLLQFENLFRQSKTHHQNFPLQVFCWQPYPWVFLRIHYLCLLQEVNFEALQYNSIVFSYYLASSCCFLLFLVFFLWDVAFLWWVLNIWRDYLP